jgi:hypothetical protein
MIELALPSADKNVWIGELAIIDLRAGQLERHCRHRRQVLDEQDRETLGRHLVDRTERDAHAVSERQVLVDERSSRQRCGIQLPL